MKVRLGFVTNSSSSSFLVIRIKSDKLREVIDIYRMKEKMLNPVGKRSVADNLTLTDRGIELRGEWSRGEYSVSSPLDILNALLIEIQDGRTDEILEISENEDTNIEFEKGIQEDYSIGSVQSLAEKIFKHRNEILGDMEEAEYNSREYGYGGDDDSRANLENYSEEYLNQLRETLAYEKFFDTDEGVDISKITDDEIIDYLIDKTGVSEISYRYDRKSGISETKTDYYVED